MGLPQIYADFHNADVHGRVRLNCAGTMADLSRDQLQLREGLAVVLYADDADNAGHPCRVIADGTVTFSDDEHCWVAVIDWQQIRHARPDSPSDARASGSGAVLDGDDSATAPTSTRLGR